MELFTIAENIKIASNTYRMIFEVENAIEMIPGQFINIKLDGFYLRRPISVCDINDRRITIIYKTVGDGTQKMAFMREGDKLDVLYSLGNGYNLSKSGQSPLLIGGGAGVPPMYYLAKKLIESGKRPVPVLGFNKKDEVFMYEEFKNLGLQPIVSTCDGSVGIKGFVTDALKGLEYDYLFTCGPAAMMKAVYMSTECGGQFSFEERMGCGFGACMGCTCRTKYAYKRICKDGPVLEREEIIW